MNPLRKLSRLGLLNIDAPDIGEISSEPIQWITKALCDSLPCAGMGKPRVKDVNKKADTCPDCGCYLKFKTERKRDD